MNAVLFCIRLAPLCVRGGVAENKACDNRLNREYFDSSDVIFQGE